jgi:hypothetical protein
MSETAQGFILGGREFREIAVRSINNRWWTERHIRQSGVDRIKQEDGESAETFIVRITDRLTGSGEGALILGGLIIPSDVVDLEWKPETGIATSQFILKLHEDEDAVRVNNLLLSALLPFFVKGLTSLGTLDPSLVAQALEGFESQASPSPLSEIQMPVSGAHGPH